MFEVFNCFASSSNTRITPSKTMNVSMSSAAFTHQSPSSVFSLPRFVHAHCQILTITHAGIRFVFSRFCPCCPCQVYHRHSHTQVFVCFKFYFVSLDFFGIPALPHLFLVCGINQVFSWNVFTRVLPHHHATHTLSDRYLETLASLDSCKLFHVFIISGQSVSLMKFE